jgi:hypothetical protein
MKSEYRSFLFITAEKSSQRRSGEIFRRYVNALAYSPRRWFRLRDCDALARFSIAATLACNDVNTFLFSDAQFEVITEIGDTMYDAVAFFKHRAEGETNNTFAYIPSELRTFAFHQARELLWALDLVFSKSGYFHHASNFIRFFGGPIHMMMRRYRFVEEGLTVGKAETDAVINEARDHIKLWNRIDAECDRIKDLKRYKTLIAESGHLLYCVFRDSYGAKATHQFGGVEKCMRCQEEGRAYLKFLPFRAIAAFPELSGTLKISLNTPDSEKNGNTPDSGESSSLVLDKS